MNTTAKKTTAKRSPKIAVWENLSSINVNDHVDKKGKFNYLSWTWAWATLKEEYPDSTYKFRDILWLPNDTCEVWVELTVEGQTHEMWLAVTNSSNKPIVNPSSDMVANARMRCLVKAIAMFGLGHYIYAGESLPMSEEVPAAKPEPPTAKPEVVQKIKECRTVAELGALWAKIANKPLYAEAKDAAKKALEELEAEIAEEQTDTVEQDMNS